MNWWAIIIISMWISGGLGAGLSKDSDCLAWSFVGSICLGILYCIIN